MFLTALAQLAVVTPLFGGFSAPADSAPLDSLRVRIERRIATVRSAETLVGVAFRDLGSGQSLDLNADSSMHAASTMKVPVMIELFRRADAGALRLDQDVLLVNQFASIVDGSPYSLDAGDDSDSLVYRWVGSRVTIHELLDRMITRSSNLATNELIELVGAARANATAHALGARDIRVLRGVEDDKAYRAGLNNTTTARDLATLLMAIERGAAASRTSCDSMRAILLRNEDNVMIPAGLPPGMLVAHKTGQITAIRHDAAIVYPPGRAPYVLVVLTRGISAPATAETLAADISRMVFEHAMRSAGVATREP